MQTLLSRLHRCVGTVAALTVMLVASGCSDATTPETDAATATPSTTTAASPSPSPSSSRTAQEMPLPPRGPSVDISVSGADIKPNGARVKLERGERLRLRFDTDRAGELHVHSTPEQVVKFPAGTSTRVLVIKSPGLVEVEEHETSFVVLQLEVS